MIAGPVAAVLVVAGLSLALVTPAGATSFVSGSSTLWELDGNLVDNPGTSGGDFGVLSGLDHAVCPDPGNGDSVHQSNDKLEDDDDIAGQDMAVINTSTPAKTDFCAIDSTSVVDFSTGSPHVWAVIGWQTVPAMCDNTSGAVMFELAKNPAVGPDGWFTEKGLGDLTVWFGYTPASGKPGAQMLSYSGEPSNQYTNIDMDPIQGGPQPLLVAGGNSPYLKWAWDDVSCVGEIMVDMTALGLMGTGPACTTFAGMQAHSQSNDSVSSITTQSLQDGVLPVPASISNCPNLAIAKTDGKTSIEPGVPNTYTVTVTNQSPAQVLNAPINDFLPTGFTPTGWTCSVSTDADTAATEIDDCDAGATGSSGAQATSSGGAFPTGAVVETVSLEPGSAITITVTGTVSRTATGTLSNKVVIDDGDDDPGTDDESTDTTTVRTPNIGITKTAVDCVSGTPITTVADGTDICFDIVATNTDNGVDPVEGPALNLSITDVLPTDAGTSWSIESVASVGGSLYDTAAMTSAADDPACAIAAGTLTCDGGTGHEFDLAVGGAVTVRIKSTTTTATIATAPVTNSATVDADNDTPETGTDEVGFLGANLDIDKVVVECPDGDAGSAVPSLNVGENVCFSITVSNVDDPAITTDGSTALDVTLTDVMPTDAGLSWSTASVDGTNVAAPSCSPTSAITTLTCGGAGYNLAVGSSFTVVVSSPTTTATLATSPITNTATADASNATEVTDTDEALLAPAVLEIDKVADAGTVDAGESIGYSIVVTNSGSGDAYDVVMTDSLPVVDGVTWSITSGSPTATGGSAPTCQITGTSLPAAAIATRCPPELPSRFTSSPRRPSLRRVRR